MNVESIYMLFLNAFYVFLHVSAIFTETFQITGSLVTSSSQKIGVEVTCVFQLDLISLNDRSN